MPIFPPYLSLHLTNVKDRWLKDKFGLSWQVVPDVLLELVQDSDSEKSERVMNAMMQRQKLDIEGLKKAAEGRVAQREGQPEP